MAAECVRCGSPLVDGEDESEVCMGCADHLIPHEHGGYGFFPGGDPRCFSPDSEESGTTPEEHAAWVAACKQWDAAEAAGTRPGGDLCCFSIEPVPGGHVIVTRVCFGLGGYSYPCTDPNCEDSWPRDPEPNPEKFLEATTWDAAVNEAFAGDDEDVSDQEESCS